MPKYTVIVTRDATESAVVSVSAEDEAKARDVAIEHLWKTSDPVVWELDDPLNSAHPYVTDVSPEPEPLRWAVDMSDGGDVLAVNGVPLKTRADLMKLEFFKHLEVDDAGNPCVWRNYYARDTPGETETWSSDWSCQCDDDGIEPFDCDWIGPDAGVLREIWEGLPDHE